MADDPDELTALSEPSSKLDTMDALLARVARAPEVAPGLQQGAHIGRYVLLTRIGAGAMGVVWAAYDPQLDRKVAVKVLTRDARAGSDGSERAAREARALARLVHGNIVAVFDAGIADDGLYVVMELIDGMTLRAWLAERERSRDEILDAFRQAAAGLIAAHEAKLVHRDFKPDNVLVGKDGRIRVADFGLARIASAAEVGSDGPTPDLADAATPLDEHSESAGVGALPASPVGRGRSPLGIDGTVTLGIAGTPAYMAPEQLDGAAIDHRCDQFAFAVSLWSALYGAAPFGGATRPARRAAIAAGPTTPASRGVPGWLHALVRRGLAERPDDRHPSMQAMLAAIEHGRGRRRRAVIGGVLVVAVAGLVPLIYLASAKPSAPAIDACDGGAAEIRTVWTTERSQAIASAFPSTPAGAQGARAVRAHLDAYASSWATAHHQVCVAARDGSQSTALFDRQTSCLARARTSLDAVVSWIAGADHEAIEHASEAIDRLPWVERCSDLGVLALLDPEPTAPAARARIDAVEQKLARLRAELDDPRVLDGPARSQAAMEEARTIGWAPLLARAAWLYAEALDLADRPAEAIAAYQEAIRASVEGGDNWTAVWAMSELARGLAKGDRGDDARFWIGMARAMQSRTLGTLDVEAELHRAAAAVAGTLGDFDEAITEAEAAVAVMAQTPRGERSSGYALDLGNLAMTLYSAKRFQRADETMTRAIAIREAAQGAGHPGIADQLGKHGLMLMDLGRLDEASATMTRALGILETWYGADSAQVADLLQNLGMLHARRRDFVAARDASLRALAIVQQREPGSSQVARIEVNLGIFAGETGDHDAAVEHGRRALAGLEAEHGADSPRLIGALILLGISERKRAALEASARYLQRAVAIAEIVGPSHPWTGNPRVELATTEIARRRFAEAIALVERVIADSDADDSFSPGTAAEARITLADALWRADLDRPRARRLAAEARDRYAALGGGYEESLAAAQRWLDAHP